MRTPTSTSEGYGFGLQLRSAGCAPNVYQHGGQSYATTSSVFVSGDGKQVAVLLTNGATNLVDYRFDPRGGNSVVEASRQLFCAS